MTTPHTDSLLVQIEKPVYGGAFLARVEGKAIFVPLALAGEQARVRIVDDKRGYASAEIEEIVAASPERIAPACPHFGACGGCNYQHTGYAQQLGIKQTILRETLERAGVHAPDEIAVLSAEPWAYRNRIRLAFDTQGRLGYRGRRSHGIVAIAECPIAAPLLVHAAMQLAQLAHAGAAKLPLHEVSLFCNAEESALLATVELRSGDAKRLQALAAAWAQQIPQLAGVQFVQPGRNGKPARTLTTWGEDSLAYSAAGAQYRVDHGAFFQVNRWLVDPLVDAVTAGASGKLAWDLYAGVGLFARKLGASFERVIAVESAPPALAPLAHNLRATAGEAVRAETLAYLRRTTQPKPDLVVVDPPRTGLGAEVTSLLGALRAPAIAYVSCDPATLARDLRTLTASGYSIASVTLADLFPQTFHLETIVHLRLA
ncbi:MAG TPA: 23S rRNA (uracil(1939)-C(5))-methyltransferase RlmD [Terracidiphilus sp.]